MKPQETDAVLTAILAEVGAAYRGARMMRIPERDVEDVVQEAIVAVWRRGQRGDLPTDTEALGVYVFVTAKNIALDHWRGLGRVDLPGELPEPFVDPLPLLEARSALRALPKPTYLRAFYECLVAEDSLAACMEKSGVPRGTVCSRVRKLRIKLRRA